MKPLNIVSGFFLLLSCFCVQAIDFNALLKQADKTKVSDPEAFNQTIEQLNQHEKELSVFEKDELDYLSVFESIRQGEYPASIAALERIFSKTQSLRVKIRTRLSISNLYAFTGSYEQAFLSLKFVTEHIDNIQDIDLKRTVYRAMSNTYFLSNQYEVSLKFSQLLLELDDNDLSQCWGKVYQASAKVRGHAGSITEEAINRIINHCVDLGQLPISHLLRLTWVSSQVESMTKPYDLDRLDKYLGQLNKSSWLKELKLFKSMELLESSLKAQIYWMKGDEAEAELFAKQVMSSTSPLSGNEAEIGALKILKSITIAKNNHVLAYQYLSQLSEIEAAFKRENQMKQMAFMNVQHANLARELEFEQLSKANNLLKIQQKLDQHKATNQKLLVSLLLIVLLILAYVLYRMKLRHDELQTIAEMDHLTKVLNRKGLELQMTEMLADSKTLETEVHIAILDLDHFKVVNDQYGHLTGDWILKHVIYEVKRLLDSKMMIGRLGGEEFGLLCQGLSANEVDKRLEKIRVAIEALDCTESGHDINITASFGVTSTELSGYSEQMMLAHADLALYQAKSRGRNLVVRYQYIN